MIDSNDPYAMKINPLARSIGFMESIKYLQAFHQLEDKNLHFDFGRKKSVKKQYQKLASLYLEDFKAKNRQFAKRQNIWFRKENDYLWVDVMSEGKIHNVVNKLIGYLRKPDISDDLASDEQEKMKNANTDEEVQKQLREYKSEGRIVNEYSLFSKFMRTSLHMARMHEDVVMNPLFKQENDLQAYSNTINTLFKQYFINLEEREKKQN